MQTTNKDYIGITKLKSKDEIKKEADEIAEFFGYNIASDQWDVVNVKHAYCEGYARGIKDLTAENERLLALNKELVEALIKMKEVHSHIGGIGNKDKKVAHDLADAAIEMFNLLNIK